MSLSMRHVAHILLVSLALVGHGRRVQRELFESTDKPHESLAALLLHAAPAVAFRPAGGVPLHRPAVNRRPVRCFRDQNLVKRCIAVPRMSDAPPSPEDLDKEREELKKMSVIDVVKKAKDLGVYTRAMLEKWEVVDAIIDYRKNPKPAAKAPDPPKAAGSVDAEVVTGETKKMPKENAGAGAKGGNPFTGGGGGNPFAGGMPGMGGAMGGNPFAGGMPGAMGGGNPFAGGMPGMGGGMPGGMPGMGGGMPGMGGGMPGMGGMGGGMGGMPPGMGEMMQKMMSNPRAMELMQKAQSNPKVMAAMADVQKNGPQAMQKYANDPEVKSILDELQKLLG